MAIEKLKIYSVVNNEDKKLIKKHEKE